MRPTEPVVATTMQTNGIQHETQIPREVWVLTYEGAVCTQRKDHRVVNDSFKYVRTMWTNRTMANNHADRCNVKYQTNKFGIRQIK